MGTSKKRGGAKAHKKRVDARNQQVKNQQNAMQKFMNESMKRQIEEMRKKYESESGEQENKNTPKNASEMMLTTNDDIIKSIPSDDETTDLDITSIEGLEVQKENIEPTA